MTTGNESSMILHLEYGEFDMLFTGDVEKEGEEQLLGEGLKQTEILKAAHHGSKNSTSSEFLQKVQPEQTIIDSLSAVCMDISREKEPLRTSA